MRPETQRLAAVDEANLVLDHTGQVNVFLVACLLAPGGFVGPNGEPDLTLLRATVRERIATLPQLRKMSVASCHRHRWVEVQPDLEHHIRLAKTVDGVAGFEQACAELMSTPLAMDRPHWEILVMPGTAAGGIGVVLRIHHAVADGIAAAAIVEQLFDPVESQGMPTRARPVRVPEQAPRRDVPHAPRGSASLFAES